LILILNNIEQRKWAEVKYKNLFENSPNAILFIDFRGVIIDANQSTQKVFGYKEDFFIGKSLEDFDDLFPIELKNFYKKTFQAYFKKEFPKPIEIKIKTELNDCVWLEVQASVIKQDNNIYIQLLFQNITEKKKRELLEQKFKEDLEKEVEARTGDLNFAFQQQKKYVDQILKSSQFKTEFMSTMSHELRTPLNAIIGFTELLLEEVYGPLNTEQREFVNDIKISAEDQFEMIKNILNISKIESGQITMKIQSFSLNSMIEQIFSSLKPLIGNKKLQFRVVGLENEKMLEADPIRFKEILLNLLSNAVKFTIEGIITLKIKELNDKWEFEVSDMGIGIDTKDFPIIFKDFKRVDSTYVRSVPGTGLGLSLTKRLIELHGGEITFYSVLGVGTTFCFSIIKKFSNLNT
jgi:PAS domain S-box-containing protein